MNDYKELIDNLKYLSDAVRYPIVNELHAGSLMEDAANAIEQLVLDIDAVRKERDAAVADIKKNWMCATCSKRIVGKEWLYCLHLLSVEAEDGSRTCLNYKWRGVQE